jgi:hypothetical protein
MKRPGGAERDEETDLLMDLTNSAAEGWRMRSRKSCQASGAVEVSPPPSIVTGSGGRPGNRRLGSPDWLCYVGGGEEKGVKGRRGRTDGVGDGTRIH